MKKNIITIATRESPLALAQTAMIRAQLQQLMPDLKVELLPMKTTGDRWLAQSLATVGGKGLFIKELEEALLTRRADLAVHSVKDMPAELPEGLVLGAMGERGPVHDVLISRDNLPLAKLKNGAVVGTSSLRRACQLKANRPDLQVKLLRGNINTRFNKLEQGEYDAIVLAFAGIQRLELPHAIAEHFNPTEFIPAIGQGVLGIECRVGDEEILALLKKLEHGPTRICVQAERALSQRLGGSCHVPLGGYAFYQDDGKVRLQAMLGEPDGAHLLKSSVDVDINCPEGAGIACAEDLLAQGGEAILQGLR